MENNPVDNKIGVTKSKTGTSGIEFIDLKTGTGRSSQVILDLVAEGGEDFYHYLQFLNLVHIDNMIVLSPRHHYYFEYHDLADVRVVVNIIRLNQIKNLNSFLSTVYNVLPARASFIGCFSESKSTNGGIPAFIQPLNIFNQVVNLLISKTERIMSRKDVLKLFPVFGFKVDDITEINGLMYFNALVKKDLKKER